jgi:5,10-methylenetetrahydromethanopterin reductase
MEFQACIDCPSQPRQMADIVRLAEELGYARFWVTDQTFHADPFVMLHAASQASSIPLGLGVTNPFVRHPAQIARAVATIRHLAPDTDLIVGLGTANPQLVLGPLGVVLHRPARNVSAAIDMIRALLRGERVMDSDSDLAFAAHDIQLDIEPCSIPLFIGTRGPRLLEEAGRVADGVLAEALFSPTGIRWARSHLDLGSRSAGLPAFVRPYVAWQVVSLHERGARVSIEARKFAVLLLGGTSDETLQQLGVPSQVAMAVRSGEISHEDLPEEIVRTFVAAGTSDQVGDLVETAEREGADAWCAGFVGAPDECVAMMRRFATDIMRHF